MKEIKVDYCDYFHKEVRLQFLEGKSRIFPETFIHQY